MALDRERLAERLDAVERRLTDADPDEGGLADVAAVDGRLSELETRADDLDERLGEVESGLQALRGYLGGVDAVDESVERRADAALAKAEELEALLVDEPGLAVERVPTDGGRNGDGWNGDARGDDGGSTDTKHGDEWPGSRSAVGTSDNPHGGRAERNGTHDHGGAPNAADDEPWEPAGSFDGGDGDTGEDAGSDGSNGRLVERIRDAL